MSPSTSIHVLQLDIQGTPQAWITVEQAAIHLASDSVAWVDGIGPLRRRADVHEWLASRLPKGSRLN